MRFLPSNLAALAVCAARSDTKYAISAVHLKEEGSDGYRIESTDTRILAVVTGKENPEGHDLPCFGVAASQPNGGVEALIPAKQWASLLKPSKEQRKAASLRPTLDCSAVVLGAKPEKQDEPSQIATFISSDNPTQHSQLQVVQCIEGRYPPCGDIQPRGKVVSRVSLQISHLLRLLEAAQRIAAENDVVTIEICADRKSAYGQFPQPVRFLAQPFNKTQLFYGLVMPLSDAGPYVDPLATKKEAADAEVK